MVAAVDITPQDGRVDILDGAPLSLAAYFLGLNSNEGHPLLARWNGDVYRYSEGQFRLLSEERLEAELYRFLDTVNVRVTDAKGVTRIRPLRVAIRPVQETRKALNALLPCVEGEQPRWIDGRGSPHILACPNGLLDLETFQLLAPSPNYFTTNVTGAAWDPEAAPPTEWLEFLASLWPDDPQSISVVQQTMGYLLSSDTSQQKMFLLVGPPRSGKGTIAKVIRALVGVDAVVNPILGTLADGFGLAPLIGKKVAIIGDARLGGKMDQTAIAEKLLSLTGEDAISINRKFREPLTIRPGARVVFVTNELPQFRDAATAIATRFVVIPTTKSFLGREDRGLEARLLSELPGILRWAVEGYRVLLTHGHFEHATQGRAISEDLCRLASPLTAFIDECCVRDDEAECVASELFDRWRMWCDGSGQEPGTIQRFGANLRAALPGLQSTRPRKGHNQVLTYRGLRLSYAE